MRFTHVLLTRPVEQSRELAERLEPLGVQAVVQPAFDYVPLPAAREQSDVRNRIEHAGEADMVIFTSPRAVEHGLPQLPAGCLGRMRVAAIGPATAKALERAGVEVTLRAAAGYTSEALLEALDMEAPGPVEYPRCAYIIAAPGGREALEHGFRSRGWAVRKYLVYRSQPAPLDPQALARLAEADGLLAVWTSGNAMSELARRLPEPAWRRVCAGDWLVISERLGELARRYGARRVHLAAGPGNGPILEAIRGLL